MGVGLAGALMVIILAGAAVNEYWLKPRHVLASVDGTDIRRREYWKYRAVDLADQANQYAAIANSPFIEEGQRQQYITFAQQAAAQIDQVWGSTDLDERTLQEMIDDQIYLQNLDDFGISIAAQDVEDYIDSRFQPTDAPIFTPTPSPTLIPERAEWATETAIAFAEPAELEIDDPATPIASPELNASPIGPPDAVGTPVADEPAQVAPTVDPPSNEASPFVSTPEAATPVTTEEPTPTPSQEEARQTATANYEEYEDALFDRANLSREDYVRLIVRPAIARERINEILTADIGQRAEQVHASHILVDTRDLADAIYRDLIEGTADFAQVALDQSIDAGTAQNGGDLGWFTRGQMVDEFEEVAFDTPPGEISEPVQTQFGWHIIQVHDHNSERAMTDDQITQLQSTVVQDWMTARKAEARIESDIAPTPTPAGPQNFVPPPDAPPLPTPTPDPLEDMSEAAPNGEDRASPESGSELPGTASPISLPATPATD